MAHFYDIWNGNTFPGVEVSTIDTAIMVLGGIFAKNYFQDEEIS
jgi:hypothetical protein